MTRARAVILPVVLFVLILIGLLAAMFAFQVYADLASSQAVAYRFQSRLAAEAGIERVKQLLRTSRFDRRVWYDNPDLFNRIIVSAHGRDARTAGTNEEFDETMVFRFSIVADDPTDDKDFVRFGITDESAKLNLNTATPDQLLKLVSHAVGENDQVDPQIIVDAIIDWRDSDATPSGEDAGTEGEYYRSLEKPYRVKNAPLDTVEELLLVKGVTPEVLYGEDFDRNGLISENEKDGDRLFPPDNQDDVLNRGLYPYLTVLSAENNVSNDNRPRVYLLGDEAIVRAELEVDFPDSPGVVDYIVSAVKKPAGNGQGGGGQGGGKQAGGGQQGAGNQGGGQPGTGQQGGAGGEKLEPQQQRRDEQTGSQQSGAGSPGGDDSGSEGQGAPNDGDDGQGAGAEGSDESQDVDGGADGRPGGSRGTDDGSGGGTPIRSPASLMLPRTIDGQLVQSPLSVEDLAVLMDRTTTVPQEKKTIPGLININTAPRLVLECIDGLTPDRIEGILAKRDGLNVVTAATPAWLVSEGIMDAAAFEKIAPQITARGQQFTIESVGFADHIGMVTRLQVVVDMNGPIAQTVSYRDISMLGGAYPIREADKEKMRAH